MKIRWIFLIIALVAIAGFLAWRTAGKKPTGGASKGGGGGAGRTVAVVPVDVIQKDVPIWLSGLGNVQAYNTVTLRPQVNGTLQEINFTEGQMVKAGDVLARIDPRSYQSALDKALAGKANNDAQLANARLELTRVRALVESEAEGKRLLEQQQAQVAQFEAMVKGDEAAIAAAQLDLDFTYVRAPISGRTGVRMVDAGNLVTANQSGGLVVIAQLQPISVIFSLPQGNLPLVRRQMQTGANALRVQALGEKGVILAEGSLELIDNQVEAATGTVRLKATFANEDYALWPGQFVTARVLVETRLQSTVVPAEVVQAGINGPFAYVIKSDQTVEARPLKVGPSVEGLSVIEEGLKSGERVVRDGQSKLQPGAKVSTGGRKS
ncbi:MAG TPA: efflux RND transporter periplasmic adaptor subunit [Opitutaceae bacterium]|nr:efflux RND transporter periplasmic adaptor subunit [Opitutaceae bacterium]